MKPCGSRETLYTRKGNEGTRVVNATMDRYSQLRLPHLERGRLHICKWHSCAFPVRAQILTTARLCNLKTPIEKRCFDPQLASWSVMVIVMVQRCAD